MMLPLYVFAGVFTYSVSEAFAECDALGIAYRGHDAYNAGKLGNMSVVLAVGGGRAEDKKVCAHVV